MRIISGSKKGHSIFSHKDKDVRPLSDKNRETIFNILTHGKEIINTGFQIEKSNVLDLLQEQVHLVLRLYQEAPAV